VGERENCGRPAGASSPGLDDHSEGRGISDLFVPDYVRSVLELLAELRALDRALALASKMFIALIPMALLASTVFTDGASFADGIVARFGLTGEGADAVRTLFASPAQVRGGITALSVLILAYSVISLARGLQRLYEAAWHLPGLKLGGLVRAMAWMLTFAIYVTLVTPIQTGIRSAGLDFLARFGAILLGTIVWVWTPFILLAGRVERRRLWPTGVITAVCFAVFSVLSRVYMPAVMTTDAHRYGLIGAAFGMVSWLFAAALVLVVTAALGARFGAGEEASAATNLGSASGSARAASSG
jgi:membrane protein